MASNGGLLRFSTDVGERVGASLLVSQPHTTCIQPLPVELATDFDIRQELLALHELIHFPIGVPAHAPHSPATHSLHTKMPGKANTLLALSAMLTITQVAAKPTFPSRLPNGANVIGVDALGHVDTSGGGDLNAFGADFSSAGLVWTTALCETDSDSDGQTNGQELGDPCCKWVAKSNEKVQWTTGASHPGDASSTSDPSLWATITCGVTSAATNATAPSNATSTTKAPSSTIGPTTSAPSTSTTTPVPSSSNTTSKNSTPNATTSVAAATSASSLAMVSVAVVATALAAVFA